MSYYIIRRIRLAHCKRGPAVCEKCREMDIERICLLEVCPPDEGMVQRRVIQGSVDGEEVWREFEVARVFENEVEAREYASQNGIGDVKF
jgi:hypothetical protein